MTAELFTEPRQVVRLWAHECDRVFADRMMTHADVDKYAEMRVRASRKFFPELPQVRTPPLLPPKKLPRS